MTSNPYSNCFAALDENAVLLTPHQRLSASLHRAYDAEKIAGNTRAWQTPRILPEQTWIKLLWEIAKDGQTAKLLLNTEQEQMLWERVIAESDSAHSVLQLHATAALLRSGYQLIREWDIDLEQTAFDESVDYQVARQWFQTFEKQITEHAWICAPMLSDFVYHSFQTKSLPAAEIPSQVFYIALSELSPQLKKLLQCFNAINLSANISAPIDCFHLSAANMEAEITTMARWAKSFAEKNPGARIACVVPTLSQDRERITQIFSAVFAEAGAFTIATDDLPFQIGAGKNLSNYPIIQFAFKLLQLKQSQLTIEDVSALLLSPFLVAAESERESRARLDFLLRDANIYRLNLKKICDQSSPQYSLFTRYCPLLLTQLQLFYAHVDTLSSTSFQAWGHFFSELLSILGWPGERNLNREEYQTLEVWFDLLSTMQTLDLLSSPVDYQTALTKLIQAAERTLVPSLTMESNIKILSVAEAVGVPFDAIWITGMHELNWPPPPSPHPFIPKSIQRQLKMPHATPTGELSYCERLLQQFYAAAPVLRFSYAEQIDGLHVNPSPLLKSIPNTTLRALGLSDYMSPEAIIFAAREIESITDAEGPALTEALTAGGVSILKQQAACPFKAFVEHRLHARPLAVPTPGLNASERGTLIHAALEKIWLSIQNQSNLIALSETELSNIITHSIAQIFTVKKELSPRYLASEKKRLLKLLFDWLTFEKKRDHFSVIACESTLQVNYQQLNFKTRIDRIDQLENGQQLIIDYKTGQQQDTHDWFGERPDEPQLPLYALTNTEGVCGIAFAQVATGNHRFKGIAAVAVDIPGIKLLREHKAALDIAWPVQIERWQQHFNQLAANFVKGVANVNPKDSDKTCQYCALKSFCRIYEYT